MLHPTTAILLWAVAVVVMQSLAGLALAFCALPVIAAALILSPRRLVVLLRRTRWIFLSVLVLFLYATPGLLLFPDLGWASPTREGARMGADQLLRLAALLGMVALVMERFGQDRLLAGIYGLLKPLRRVGVSADAVALRLNLVLRYIAEERRTATGKGWREWLDPAPPPAAPETEIFVLRIPPFIARDWVLLLAGGALAAAVLVFR